MKRQDDKYVKMLRSYNEAIVNGTDTNDLYPDPDKTAEQYDDEKLAGDHDAATQRAEQFMTDLYQQLEEIVIKEVTAFKKLDPLNDGALDIVLEYQCDGSSDLDMDKFGFANYVYTIMWRHGKTTDRGGINEPKFIDKTAAFKQSK